MVSQEEIEKERQAKAGAEILRYAGCLDNVDNDVAEAVIKVMPKEGHLISLAELTEEVQKIKNGYKKQVREAINEVMNGHVTATGFQRHRIVFEELEKELGF